MAWWKPNLGVRNSEDERRQWIHAVLAEASTFGRAARVDLPETGRSLTAHFTAVRREQLILVLRQEPEPAVQPFSRCSVTFGLRGRSASFQSVVCGLETRRALVQLVLTRPTDLACQDLRTAPRLAVARDRGLRARLEAQGQSLHPTVLNLSTTGAWLDFGEETVPEGPWPLELSCGSLSLRLEAQVRRREGALVGVGFPAALRGVLCADCSTLIRLVDRLNGSGRRAIDAGGVALGSR